MDACYKCEFDAMRKLESCCDISLRSLSQERLARLRRMFCKTTARSPRRTFAFAEIFSSRASSLEKTSQSRANR